MRNHLSDFRKDTMEATSTCVINIEELLLSGQEYHDLHTQSTTPMVS